MKKILITGGAGFIGSHVVRRFVNNYPEYEIVNLDALTYAGNLANLKDVEDKSNYRFIKANIIDASEINTIFSIENFDAVIHLMQQENFGKMTMKINVFIMFLQMKFTDL